MEIQAVPDEGYGDVAQIVHPIREGIEKINKLNQLMSELKEAEELLKWKKSYLSAGLLNSPPSHSKTVKSVHLEVPGLEKKVERLKTEIEKLKK